MLSERGRRALHDPNPLVAAHFRAAANPWSAGNPGGIINFGTAENRLVEDVLRSAPELLEGLGENHYVELHGTDAAREAIAAFHGHMHADRMALTSGVSAAIDVLATNLFDAGDKVMVPAPYYPGFMHCLEGRAEIEVVPAPMPSPDFAFSTDTLDAAWQEGVKGLLLCTPHNPLGHVYSEDDLRAVIAWCKDRGVTLIADEIYLHSVFDGTATSILAIDPDIITLYGLAKDVGLSGWKVGAIHTTDDELLAACRELAYFTPVSSQTQSTVTALLPAVGDALKATSRERLAAAYESIDLPHTPAQAGLFAWLDLRAGLRGDAWDAEADLHARLLDAGVLLAPGQSFGATEPGWFRMCFALDPAAVAEGQRRIATVMAAG